MRDKHDALQTKIDIALDWALLILEPAEFFFGNQPDPLIGAALSAAVWLLKFRKCWYTGEQPE